MATYSFTETENKSIRIRSMGQKIEIPADRTIAKSRIFEIRKGKGTHTNTTLVVDLVDTAFDGDYTITPATDTITIGTETYEPGTKTVAELKAICDASPVFKTADEISASTGQQKVETPEGNLVNYQISGRKAYTNTALAAGGVWQTPWLRRESYNGAETTIYSDKSGSYTIEYSDNAGQSVSMPLVTVPYTFDIGTRRGVFGVAAEWVRFKYTNGNEPQTTFKFEIRFLSQSAQASMEVLGATGADSRLAMWTKSRIETKDGSGSYGGVNRTGDSLNVHVANGVDVTGAFWPETQPVSGTVTANVSFPSTQAVSGTVTANVAFPATQPVSLATNTPDVTDRAGRLLGKVTVDATVPVTGQFYPETQPVSISSNTPDVTDRATRLLGHVTVDNTVTVSGNVNANVTFPATQPVSLTTNTPDITDRSGRQLGHVVVDNTVPVSVTFPSVQPVSGTVNVSFPSVQTVSGTVTANVTFPATQAVTGQFYQATQPVSMAGVSTASNQTAANATLTSIDAKTPAIATTGALTAVTLAANVQQTIAASATAKGRTVFSVSGTILIGLGFTATANNYTARIVTNGYYEVPAQWSPLSISLFCTSAATVNVTTIS